MRIHISLSAKVAVGIIVGLLLLSVILAVTRQVWFDNPSETVARRMDIIGQLIVGVGTAALAIVTWASVYETQQVLSGEDLRFRQSRMPMVSLSAIPTPAFSGGEPGFTVVVRNTGDGAAQDVWVQLDATVSISWDVKHVRGEVGRRVSDSPIPGGTTTGDVPTSFERAASYLSIDDYGTGFIGYKRPSAPDSTSDLIIANESESHEMKRVTIRYTDVFGEEFTTTHLSGPDGFVSLRDFSVVRPQAYLKGKKVGSVPDEGQNIPESSDIIDA